MLKPTHMKAISFYLEGWSKRDSLLKAGYSKTTAYTDPDSVFGREDVKAEIKRRREAMEKENELNEAWITSRLMKIADANLGDLIEFDDDGKLFINYEKMSPEMRVAIGGMEIDEYKKGRGPNAVPVTKIRIKMADKLRALEMLMKVLGIDRQKVEVGLEQDLINRLLAGRARVAKQVEDNDAADDSET